MHPQLRERLTQFILWSTELHVGLCSMSTARLHILFVMILLQSHFAEKKVWALCF